MIDDRATHSQPYREERLMTDRFLRPTMGDLAEADGTKSPGELVASIIIANAPDPVFVSDLDGKILQANDAV